ncbi:MAG TPA: class I lanthipeptide [Chitinophaga sp.]|uniref:class I lanthipeptide n=1 Tax=Chitinophaga sp. TaxID=1869181 RepID=UPI002B693A05|nr:class I lanthipeptide [Chitinophaga sp.]HVI43920.1 class I lanthipeptide [Chitinophaga sp.]
MKKKKVALHTKLILAKEVVAALNHDAQRQVAGGGWVTIYRQTFPPGPDFHCMSCAPSTPPQAGCK